MAERGARGERSEQRIKTTTQAEMGGPEQTKLFLGLRRPASSRGRQRDATLVVYFTAVPLAFAAAQCTHARCRPAITSPHITGWRRWVLQPRRQWEQRRSPGRGPLVSKGRHTGTRGGEVASASTAHGTLPCDAMRQTALHAAVGITMLAGRAYLPPRPASACRSRFMRWTCCRSIAVGRDEGEGQGPPAHLSGTGT